MTDDEWLTVIGNIQKAWRSRACMLRILGREGMDVWTSVGLYLTIVHGVLMFDEDT